MKGKKVESYNFDKMIKEGHAKQQAVMATLINKRKAQKTRHKGGKYEESRYD